MWSNIINFPRRLVAMIFFMIAKVFSFFGGAFGYLAYICGDKVEDTLTEEELVAIIKELEAMNNAKVEVEVISNDEDMHEWLEKLENDTDNEYNEMYGGKSPYAKEDDDGTIH